MSVDWSQRKGAVYGVLAALLFGASAPFAKLLLPAVAPLPLAALLYLGAALALWTVHLARRGDRGAREAPLERTDLIRLGWVTWLGGVMGPWLMLWGLRRVSGSAGALLLNLEAPFTMLLAVVAFGEHLGRRELGAALLIVAGAAVMGAAPGELRVDGIGALSIALACLCWGIDNNLTQRLSLKDPLAVVRLKTLGAGLCTLALSGATHQRLPGLLPIAQALLLGALCYGVSLVFDVLALRHLGAAREAAFFATAPFAGAALAVPLLHHRPTLSELGAAAVMIVGTVLLFRARHAHWHRHERMEHEHAHVHDAHHQHSHDGPVTEPHSHPHVHEPLEHAHPHTSDLHHRHRHD